MLWRLAAPTGADGTSGSYGTSDPGSVRSCGGWAETESLLECAASVLAHGDSDTAMALAPLLQRLAPMEKVVGTSWGGFLRAATDNDTGFLDVAARMAWD